ncbi:MAG: hypothetical protein ACC652_03955 [Acidimicrobiales bacterium]
MGRFRVVVTALAAVLVILALGPTASAAEQGTNGYWLVAADGGVFAFGDAEFYGSMGGQPLNAPIVGMAATPQMDGYWLVAADGGVFAFGAAEFYGSLGAATLGKPILGIAADPDGAGYWLAGSGGWVYGLGEPLLSYGILPRAEPPNQYVGIAAVDSGEGFETVTSANCIFGFSALSDGVPHDCVPSQETIVGIAATPSGKGFVTIGSRASKYSYGDASNFLGPASIIPNLNAPIVGGALCGDDGIWYAAADGGVFAFSPAEFHGSLGDVQLNAPIVGMAGICS